MRLYTHKNYISYSTENWTGHIDDDFNKSFPLKKLNDLIVPLNDDVADIIDMCNDDKIKKYNNLSKDKAISKEIFSEIFKDDFLKTQKSKSIYNKNKETIDILFFVKDLMSKTHNTVFEFNDELGHRHLEFVFGCNLIPYDNKYIDEYLRCMKEVNEYNTNQIRDMYLFLIEKDAVEKSFLYKLGRSCMFKEIGKTINNLKEEGKL